ncbi:hypothetical protein Btru_042421 [Bulinus truncatus]|nr:hypothetical protein Btru_042421 [Bulinus truncatus]
MFNSTYQLRSKFDQFRNDLHDNVLSKISETRKEAVEAISKLQYKFKGASDEEKLKSNLSEAEQLRRLQTENHQLNQIILKMKAMNIWRQNIKQHNFRKSAADLHKLAESSKKDHIEVKMLAEEQILQLRQQLVAIRKALTATDKESNQVRKKLERELKLKVEREHEEAQKERSKTQLEKAKQVTMDKLVSELMDKETKLKIIEQDKDRSTKMTQRAYETAKREMEIIKKQLNQERSLKLDAFNRVDTLQSQVYDYETCLVSRPVSSTTILTKTRSRATSAGVSGHSRPSTVSSHWPPPIPWPANRSLTPVGEVPINMNLMNNNEKKIQRPKTVGGRLRSRIAEQLLCDLEPDTHRTIVQLGLLEGNKKV